MSIIRVGLAETKKFAEGYEAIFGKKTPEAEKPADVAVAETATKDAAEKKEPAPKPTS